MKDNCGDEIRVGRAGKEVYVDFEVTDMYLSPKKARKLAKKLKRRAAEIEADG